MSESHENKIWCRDLSGKWSWSRPDRIVPGFHLSGRSGESLPVVAAGKVKRKYVCYRVFYDGDFVGTYSCDHKFPVRNPAGNEFLARVDTISKRPAPYYRSVSSLAMGNGEGVIRVELAKSEPCIEITLHDKSSQYVTGPGLISAA